MEIFQTVESVLPERNYGWRLGEKAGFAGVARPVSCKPTLEPNAYWPAWSYSPYVHRALHPHLLYKIMEGWSPALLWLPSCAWHHESMHVSDSDDGNLDSAVGVCVWFLGLAATPPLL